MQINDTINFGEYEWRVLHIQNDRALIVTERVIDHRSYHDAYKEITWADCAIRKYLNGEFYDTFSADEKSKMVSVTNKNFDNQWYGTKGGEDTIDKIFLLSLDEVCTYFGNSLSHLCHKREKQKYWFSRKDENNSKRLARVLGKETHWWWWLRSPGRNNVKAAYVHGTDGNIGIQGNNILKGNIADGKCTGGVRPALWLKV
jgi:hypothetical protein